MHDVFPTVYGSSIGATASIRATAPGCWRTQTAFVFTGDDVDHLAEPEPRTKNRVKAMSRLSIHVARCEALFASCIQQSQNPSIEQVRTAIQQAIRKSGVRGCVAQVAHEFGEHPDAAAARMRWANQMVSSVYGAQRPHDGTGRSTRNRSACGRGLG